MQSERCRIIVVAFLGFGLLTSVFAQSRRGSTSSPTFTAESLRDLSDPDLLTMFERSALAAGMTDAPVSNNPASGDLAVSMLRDEILRRRKTIAPRVVEMLKVEVNLKRPPNDASRSPGLIHAELNLLANLADPRSVLPLLDIMETLPAPSRSDLRSVRGEFVQCVEEITFVSFRHIEPHITGFDDAIEHPSIQPVAGGASPDRPQLIPRYRTWLNEEGKDPDRWLAIACDRARSLLESKDLNAAYTAAAFLSKRIRTAGGLRPRDVRPDVTLPSLARVLEKVKAVRVGDRIVFEYEQQRAPFLISTCFLANYGPQARPYADILIRLHTEAGDQYSSLLSDMYKVGGEKIMAHCISILPAVSRPADEIMKGPASNQGFEGGDPRLAALEAQRLCRGVIERWAGRHFESDAAAVAWYAENKDKTPEQWLRDSLQLTAQRADAGQAASAYLFGHLVPDLPLSPADQSYFELRSRAGNRPPPASFREKWLAEHQAALRYVAEFGTFVSDPLP